MKLKVPINNRSELNNLIKIGVDEVYCGVLTDEWLQSFSNVASINRVERIKGNLRSYQELSEIVTIAHNSGVQVYFTLNSLYTPSQQNILKKEIDEILKTEIDGFIVCDLGILCFLNSLNTGKRIHASTGFVTFNSQTVEFLREQGISRIVLPRALRRGGLSKLLNDNRGMEFEAFVMNGRCKNVDGLCTFQHGVSDLNDPGLSGRLMYSGISHRLQEIFVKLPAAIRRHIMNFAGTRLCATACSIDYQVDSGRGTLGLSSIDFIDDIFSCGGCDISLMAKLGMTSVKIVGRSFPVQRKIKDILYIRRLIDRAKDGNFTDGEYKDYAQKLYKEIYKKLCEHKCYYYD